VGLPGNGNAMLIFGVPSYEAKWIAGLSSSWLEPPGISFTVARSLPASIDSPGWRRPLA
jgi:hypothetical protein